MNTHLHYLGTTVKWLNLWLFFFSFCLSLFLWSNKENVSFPSKEKKSPLLRMSALSQRLKKGTWGNSSNPWVVWGFFVKYFVKYWGLKPPFHGQVNDVATWPQLVSQVTLTHTDAILASLWQIRQLLFLMKFLMELDAVVRQQSFVFAGSHYHSPVLGMEHWIIGTHCSRNQSRELHVG